MQGYPPGYGSPVPLVPQGMSGNPNSVRRSHGACGHPVDKTPQTEMDKCLQALGAQLETTLQVSTLDPHLVAPFKSRSLGRIVRAVIGIPAVYDAAAFAGSVALATAAGSIVPVPLLIPTEVAPPFSAQTVYTYTTPAGYVAVFDSWGVTVQNSEPEAGNFFVEAQGPNYGSDAPSALLSQAPARFHQPCRIIIPENKNLIVKCQNLDTGSGILVNFGIMGWQLPIRGWRDSLKSMISHPGYGRECGE